MLERGHSAVEDHAGNCFLSQHVQVQFRSQGRRACRQNRLKAVLPAWLSGEAWAAALRPQYGQTGVSASLTRGGHPGGLRRSLSGCHGTMLLGKAVMQRSGFPPTFDQVGQAFLPALALTGRAPFTSPEPAA
ncbi:hypothetical protein Mal4_41040 [Maioricimonas rarisocia]|uniref:Uncharacterized protein n=1 Tax=Maioricimonas rarisocia TaxID=2528026 RepID=A0A517ZBC1_9PLAN|nr:hypothetical protein Mal4_41040 [Maioricimonas rarisocia]